MEYLWGSGLFSASDFALSFFCIFVPSKLQITVAAAKVRVAPGHASWWSSNELNVHILSHLR